MYVKQLNSAPRECSCESRRHGKAPAISAREKAVLWFLADSHSEQEGIAWPSIDSIASSSGLSPRRTQEVIAGLICKGVIGRQKRLRADGSNASNGYYFPEIDGEKPKFSGVGNIDAKVILERQEARRRAQREAESSCGNLFKIDAHRVRGLAGGGCEGSHHRVRGLAGGGCEGSHPYESPIETPENLHSESPEKSNSPLPPSQARGDVENFIALPDIEAANPAVDAEETRWASEAERVMRECSWTDRRLLPVVVTALKARCDEGDITSAEAGDLMIGNWREYVELGEFLRFTWSPRKWIAHGHWLNWKLWPLERERLDRYRNARVGS